MAELLHCSNMGLLNEVGSEELIAIRDSERRRLRTEGTLLPQRTEDDSIATDDLTMRLANPSHEERDGRRLEVMNVAEEDGFEEVEPSKEMNEDTSHEFVKAEDEMAAPSFLDKDEDDDFVDEPLSSPRLNVKDEADEHRFDEPEMMVAPLSPRKAKAAPPIVTTDVPMPEAPMSPKSPGTQSKEKDGQPDDSDSSVVYTPTTSVAESHRDSHSKDPEQLEPPTSEEEKISNESDAHKANDAKDATEAAPAEESKPEIEEAPPAPEAPEPPPTSAEKPPVSAPKETKDVEDEEGILPPAPVPAPAPPASDTDFEPGAESIIIRSLGTRGDGADAPGAPVVGDFLKMQFVEYRVVPTILVST
jgi:SIT4-associating protein SAP185/190